MEQALLLLVLSEAITENIKWVIDGIASKKAGVSFDYNPLLALVVSIFVCVMAQFDLFDMVGWQLMIPYVGSVLTGIAVSRGANILHDLFKLPGMLRKGSA